MTHREEGVVVCDELFQGGEGLFTAFDTAITGDSRIDEGVVRPFFAETAVQEEEQVQDRCRRVDEFLFVFPIEEGNRPVFPVVGDVPQGRPAVVQSGGVETGQALAGFFKGLLADVGIFCFFGDALQGLAGRFHDEEVFIQEDQFRRQAQAGVDGHDLMGFAPERGRRVLFGKGIAAVAPAAFDEILFIFKCIL